jgi:hypothetical protein
MSLFSNVIKGLWKYFCAWVSRPFDCIMEPERTSTQGTDPGRVGQTQFFSTGKVRGHYV